MPAQTRAERQSWVIVAARLGWDWSVARRLAYWRWLAGMRGEWARREEP